MAENGILNKMEIDPNEARRLKLPTTRKQQFWDIIKTQLPNLVKANLLTLILGLPFVLLVLFFIPVISEAIGLQFDFTGNLGIGYPGSVSDMVVAESFVLQSKAPLILLLIPTIGLLGIPFSGLMYTVRNMVWGESVTIKSDYWKGIKTGWKQYLAVFFLLGFFLSGIVLAIMLFKFQSIIGEVDVLGVISLICSILGTILVAGITLYLLPTMSMYNMSLKKLFKNAALLALAMFPLTFGMLILSVAPFLLGQILGSTINALIYVFMLFMGTAVLALMWTVYVQYVLDKSVNKRANNYAYKRGIYVTKEKTESEGEESSIKKNNVQKRYVNPKKKKKGEPAMNTLRENFNRDDIKKFMEEKEKYLDELNKEERIEENSEE